MAGDHTSPVVLLEEAVSIIPATRSRLVPWRTTTTTAGMRDPVEEALIGRSAVTK
jgi:hypothetical protein